MKTKSSFIALALIALSTLNSQLSTVFAQGTAFTYQGQLQNNGSPANGLYDERFMVWDAPTNGNLIAGPLTNSATGVSNGLFAVTLDFGTGVFTGPARWLELDVRTNGGNAFTTLLPLQPLLPMPYAIMANTASNLIGTLPVAQLTGALPAAQLSGTVSLSQLPLVIVTNNSTGLALSGAFSGNGAGLTNLTLLTTGQPIYMNFDSVNPGSGVDATTYLASFGITLTNVSQPGSIYIVADTNYYGTGAVTASSPHNFLLQSVGGSPPCSYTMIFSTPLQSITFTRIAISAGFAMPSWTATAYAGSDAVGSVGATDSGLPAQIYTISGQGITSLTVSGNGHGSAAAASAPLDDFYLAPETLNINGAIAAVGYSGNGSGLTSLNPANLSTGTAAINISGNAATATSATSATTAGSATTATTANNFSGSLAGDVTGTQSATVVSTVGGVTSANVASGANAANTATSANTPNTIIQRDASGNFSAGIITGNLAGNAATATTAANVTGNIADYQLSANIARLNGTNLFSGSNTFTGVTIATNSNNVFNGVFAGNLIGNVTGNVSGNGSGLTNLNALNLTGTIANAILPNNISVGGTNVIASLTVPPKLPVSAIGSVATGSSPVSITVAGRYAYVVNESDGTLQIFDVSTPSVPVSVGLVGTGTNPNSVVVAGRYAYVVDQGANKLQIFDVSDPAAPVSVGLMGTGNYPFNVAVSGRYAYVVNLYSQTLQIFDVSTPSAPVSVGSVGTSGQPYEVAVAGRYAYVVNALVNTLQVFDVSTPSAPVSVGSVSTGNRPESIAVAGRFAYVADINGGTLQIFDVSNPLAPVSVGSVGSGNSPYSVEVAGRYAYEVNIADNTLQILDVGNPSAPVSVGLVGTSNSPYSVAISGRYAYVVNVSGTLQVFDLGGAYIQQLEAGSMETGTLQTRDTVTVGNNLNVRGGFTVSGSARITGGLSVDNGTIAGNGSGLVNLNPANLGTGTAAISISGNAATATSATLATTAANATTANSFSGPLSGDVIGTQNATVVSTVGGVTSANVASGVSAANSATSANTPNTIVQRDASGNFSAGTITATSLNGAFNGDGSTLTNIPLAGLQSMPLTNGQGGVTLKGLTSVRNLSVAATNFVNYLVVSNPPAFNGSAITSLNASQLTSGAIPLAQLPSAVVLNNGTGITLNGTFVGNGSGLTAVNGTFTWQNVTGTSQQAQSNMGYLANDPLPVIITLPPSPNIGDVIRVSGIGAGGWQIAQNAGQSIIPVPFAGYFTNSNNLTNWTQVLSYVNYNDSWTSIASSADGTKWVVAGSYGEVINQIGNSVSFPGLEWTSIASSMDGSKLAATSYGNGVYASTNYGATTVQTAAGPSYGWSIASSTNGTKLVAATYYAELADYAPGSIYTSANSGSTWTKTSASSNNWISVASSDSGTKLVAASDSTPSGGLGSIYTSTTSGSSWSKSSAPSNYWGAVASSADGTKLVAAGTAGIYRSVNSGTLWTLTSAPTTGWQYIASSGDGTKLIAAANYGDVYISTDGGTTWVDANPPSGFWTSVGASENGNTLFAGDNSGDLFIASALMPVTTTAGVTGYLAGGPYASVELQYIGNGQWMPISYVGTISAY